MLTVCPSCATSYDIELASLQPNGRRVRCVRCRNVWRAEPSQADKLSAAAEAIAPVHEMVDGVQSFAAETLSDAANSPQGNRGDRADGTIGHTADANSYAAPDGSSEGPLDTEQVGEAIGSIGGVEVVAAPPIAPGDLDEGQPAIEAKAEAADEAPEDIETYAARRERRAAKGRLWHWPLSRLQSGVLALLIIDAIIIAWRDDFVRIMPQTASFYSMLGLSVNLRGLAFDDVNTATEQHDGVPIIVVDGTIVNESRKDRRRAAIEVRGTQCLRPGGIFLDRGFAAHVLASRRKRCRSAADSPHRLPRHTTFWCASSPGTTSFPEPTDCHGAHSHSRRRGGVTHIVRPCR